MRYPLLRAAAALPEHDVRESLRQAVEHGVLVAEQATGSFRFRHALLAEAIYATILPGEREELHARLAEELARSGAASPAELAPHWAAAGRSAEALAASVDAARQAEAVFGLAEAHAHLERALALWPAVPDAAELAGIDLAELCAWAAELAGHVGAAARAVELARRAIELVGAQDPHRAALLHVSLGEYLLETGSEDAALAAFERAVELVPAEPPSPERAYALGSLAGGLMVAWRYAESLPIAEQALALARLSAHARQRSGRSPCSPATSPTSAAARRVSPIFARPCSSPRRSAITSAWNARTPITDALTMLGRPRESARLAKAGSRRCAGTGSRAPCSSRTRSRRCSRSATGTRPRGSAPPRCAATPRASRTGSSSSAPTSRSAAASFDAARAHLEAASATLREDRVLGLYDAYLADLALWERRWTDADAAIRGRVWLEHAIARLRRSASSSAPRDSAHRRSWPRSPAPVGTPTRSATGSAARGSC